MTTLAKKLRVAFQGERGAFSEEAALKLLGAEIELVPRRTFADLYDSLDNGAGRLPSCARRKQHRRCRSSLSRST